ncbi:MULTISPECIES: TRAP transporter small permease subunit [unclassified Campylobacter]|uniref:TRAP transporter small permease subunit n=1 Tax=unclassified Campylobacter TaxID=2593542 RepID=UPI0022E9C91E|nr:MULTISPECIES: TRAP transporter small permease subunit [unclassified Campylobacter]MDA3054855.1 TRAP transporter small permease subunit [Campylobacter sp. VBCF_07 NA4]MDA3061112.1 TRAP transporter small permease subunit [Campylobacter sp. VBCF_02 NA5]MDA3070804.1 TRAP transporter small permease subunit [Campylobacter sp. VBCF_08 NA3]WBR54310.1 TRAP transporter small permease subunit [Campylobacter sp. VBCF_01 NA2]
MRKNLQILEKIFDSFAKILGFFSIVFLALLVLCVFYNVVARYLFPSANSVAMQEISWWLFSAMFLFGSTYTLQQNSHVRVDVLYEKFRPKTKAIINILGTIFFILPFVALVAYFSLDFALEAYESKESSPNPGGLTNLWIIKSFISLSYVFLFIYSFGFLIKNINSLIHNHHGEFLDENSSAKAV